MNFLFTFLVLHLLNGSNGQLRAEDASEGPCLPASQLLPQLQTGVDLVPVLTPGDYYLPMGSQALYREYAEGFLGRPAANETELSASQPVLRCGPSFSAIQNVGYPNMDNPPTFGQACTPVGIPNLSNPGLLSGSLNLNYVQAVCLGLPAIRPDGSVAIRASQSFLATIDSIVWANEDETAILVYRCPSNGIKDWKVVSKTKQLNSSDVEIIKEKILPLGFTQDQVTFMNYD